MSEHEPTDLGRELDALALRRCRVFAVWYAIFFAGYLCFAAVAGARNEDAVAVVTGDIVLAGWCVAGVLLLVTLGWRVWRGRGAAAAMAAVVLLGAPMLTSAVLVTILGGAENWSWRTVSGAACVAALALAALTAGYRAVVATSGRRGPAGA